MSRSTTENLFTMAIVVAVLVWLAAFFGVTTHKTLKPQPDEVAVLAPVREPVPVRTENPDVPGCLDLSIYIGKMHPEHNFIERAAIVKAARESGRCERKSGDY